LENAVITSQIENKWTANLPTNEAVWVYVASRGVSRDFPGTNISKDYDPPFRPWFKRGLAFSGKNALDAPYLDEAGAGKVVSILRTVSAGNASGYHTANDQVAAVMGLDFRYTFWRNFVDTTLPNCTTGGSNGNICWLMDSSGLLITHSTYTQSGADTVAWLGTKAARLANQFLRAGLLTTTTVTDYDHGVVCTIYQVVESLIPPSGVYIGNSAQCGTHWLAVLPGTNSYIVGYSGSTCSNVDTQPVAPSCSDITVNPCTVTAIATTRATCPDFILTEAQIEVLRGSNTCATSSTSRTATTSASCGTGATTNSRATRTSCLSAGSSMSSHGSWFLFAAIAFCLFYLL
jgi:hypothetical protein